MRITVRYVPAPVTGTVFAGTGTVWKIPTRGIPVPNPTGYQPSVTPLLPSHPPLLAPNPSLKPIGRSDGGQKASHSLLIEWDTR